MKVKNGTKALWSFHLSLAQSLPTSVSIFLFFFEMKFCSCCPGWSAMAQSIPFGFKQFSCLSLLSSWDYSHPSPRSANFVFLVEAGFLHVGQTGLELLTSGDPPALASQGVGITGVSQHARPDVGFFLKTCATCPLCSPLTLPNKKFKSHPLG